MLIYPKLALSKKVLSDPRDQACPATEIVYKFDLLLFSSSTYPNVWKSGKACTLKAWELTEGNFTCQEA